MIKASKIEHNGKTRIMIDFPYNQEIKYLLKQISDARWSATKRVWHIPYTKSAFEKLKELFPDVEYLDTRKALSSDNEHKDPLQKHIETSTFIDNAEKADVGVETNVQVPTVYNRNDIYIDVIGRKILLKMPKNETDVHFVRSLRFSRWDNTQFCWVIPNFPVHIALLKDYFKDRITRFTEHQQFEIDAKNGNTYQMGNNELLIIKTVSGRLKLIYGYSKELTRAIKQMPYNVWDKKNKWWTIPYSEQLFGELNEIAKTLNMSVSVKIEEPNDITKKPKITAYDIPNYRTCPQTMVKKLEEMRYSEHTRRTYIAAFEEFINYHNRHDISSIDDMMVVEFIRYLVTDRKVSTAYQNQSINAIKFYYEKVLGGARKVYYIDRPRMEKTLPTVLSVEEVAGLIKAVDNIKHKTILMLTYSSGLRISELLNLKLTDIDSQRKQIKVEQGKGKKDRFTVLSDKILPLLRAYYMEYKPKYFLFESPEGAKYSTTSVHIILNQAIKKAGIKKRVTMHTLRHSFATHLLEQGTDLRYIQSLLGHESTKTTQIYTHVTTKGFDQIKSPFDNLDL